MKPFAISESLCLKLQLENKAKEYYKPEKKVANLHWLTGQTPH